MDVIQEAFDSASGKDTVSAYRRFLETYKSTEGSPSGDSQQQTSHAQLYWKARAKIERLVSSIIIEEGIGDRFCMKDVQPTDEAPSGGITLVGRQDSGLTQLKLLYPGDAIQFNPADGGDGGLPEGDRSIHRFIGKVSYRGYTIAGDSSEPLSFLLLKPFGAVYLEGRGTVLTTDGVSVSLSPVLPPDAPTGLTAVDIGDSQVELKWMASPAASKYKLYRSTIPGGEGTTPHRPDVWTTSYTDLVLKIDTEYYYTVAAVNSGGASAQSKEIRVICHSPKAKIAVKPMAAKKQPSAKPVAKKSQVQANGKKSVHNKNRTRRIVPSKPKAKKGASKKAD